MVIVDDHLALLSLAGRPPDTEVAGPVATTCGFQFRMARALADADRSGSLSRRFADTDEAMRRVLDPPAYRLVVLDPRVSMRAAVAVATRHRANLLLAELVGAAIHHHAAVRVTPLNQGSLWADVMDDEGIDFATLDP